MKRDIIVNSSLLLLFYCLLAGCSDSRLDPKKPVTLTFWHVFGAQTDGPMSAVVDRFNQTVGREKGIVINVTSISNSTDIHFALVAAARKQPGAGNLPDMFVSYPKTALAIGPERLMDWKDHLHGEKLGEYVPSFVEEGKIGDRLVLLPIAKSSSALFVNATIFDRFSKETGIVYSDLATWEGMFRAAKRYRQWSGGKAFFKYDDWLHYSMLNTASLGGNFFQDGKIHFRDAQFQKVWSELAKSALAGEVCLLGGYSTTAMMTGETLCGIESTASVLYFKDKVTLPDNTTMPLRLKILPVPCFRDGKLFAIQRGGGLGVVKSTRQKEYAAFVFGQWLTETANNVPFVMETGYLPVKEAAYQNLVKERAFSFANDSYRELYATVKEIHSRYAFYIPPFFEKYGEVERELSDAQREIFIKYRKYVDEKYTIHDALIQKMFHELKQSMQ